MFFKTHAFTAPKDFGFEKENMDAYGFDPERGVVAVADGAASGLFSGPWADIISAATVADTPNLYDAEHFAAWLGERRREWCERVDLNNLNFFQRGKLQQWGGGSATLVWGEFYPLNGEAAESTGDVTTESDSSETDALDSPAPETAVLEAAELETPDGEIGGQVAEAVEHKNSGQDVSVEQSVESDPDAGVSSEPVERAPNAVPAGEDIVQETEELALTAQATEEAGLVATDARGYLFRGYAIGDSCLFHIRDGKLLKAFPLELPDEFSADPNVIGSVDRKADHTMEFQSYEARCEFDDQLIFCTDALAWWVLKQFERGPVDWEQFWSMDKDAWINFVASIRQDEEGMRLDDTTIVLLKLLDPNALSSEEGQAAADPQSLDEAVADAANDTESDLQAADVENDASMENVDEPTGETVEFETLEESEPVERSADADLGTPAAVEVGYEESDDKTISDDGPGEDSHDSTDTDGGSVDAAAEHKPDAELIEAAPAENVASFPDPIDEQSESLDLQDVSNVAPVADKNVPEGDAEGAEASIQESQPE
jgi:hypothetical protein